MSAHCRRQQHGSAKQNEHDAPRAGLVKPSFLSAAPLCVSPPPSFRPLSPPHTLSSCIHLPPPPPLLFLGIHLSCVWMKHQIRAASWRREPGIMICHFSIILLPSHQQKSQLILKRQDGNARISNDIFACVVLDSVADLPSCTGNPGAPPACISVGIQGQMETTWMFRVHFIR